MNANMTTNDTLVIINSYFFDDKIISITSAWTILAHKYLYEENVSDHKQGLGS